MPDTHAKTKVEILIERALLQQVVALIESHDISGYTVFPAIAGLGRSGPWTRDDIAPALATVLVTAIADDARARELAAAAHDLLTPYRAVILLSPVEVFRDDRF